MDRQHVLLYPSHTYLERLRNNLQNNISFYAARHQGQLQGTAVIVHNSLGAFYYYGGSSPSPVTGSLNLMHYEIMLDLKRKGVPVYDLMGARIVASADPKIEGIQRFKSRFASGMRVGYRFRKIIRPTKHRLFLAAVKTYFALRRSSYAGDVIDEYSAQSGNGQLVNRPV
jgi:lipid II:glycine glycyltransferase (peptidoglycan interpeptide bridge formation enzyme)